MGAGVRGAIAITVTAVLAALPGCGGAEAPASRVVVALDFTPNAVHAPIYTAVREHHDRRRGVRLQIRTPGSQPDSLKLLAAGRVDIGVLDIHDLAIAREQGLDVVGIAALVQRPLAAIIARPGIRRPRDLEDHVVGVSGLPSDPAFLRAVIEHDGGDYRKVQQVTIGFAAVSALLTRKIDAVPAFWNAEGVALRQRGLKTNEFRVEDFGAPRYPEVVLVTTRKTLHRRRAAIRRALQAIEDGGRSTLADPQPAVRQIAQAAGSADLRLIRAQLDAVAPATRPLLALDRAYLERWAAFDARIGLVKRRPDVGRAFDFTLDG
jgi:NitT/TauT family transport system substrate-binding protein/putative hydroxymethylpyrimidine transport system substrate-binding protein